MLEVQLTGEIVEFFTYFLEDLDVTIAINHIVVIAGFNKLLPNANESVFLRFRQDIGLIE